MSMPSDEQQKTNAISLREHLKEISEMYDRVMSERFKRAEDRFGAMDKALELAWKELGQWKVGSNEWRNTLNDLSNRFVVKESFDKAVLQIEELRRWQSQMQGLAMISSLVAIAAAVVAIWAVLN